MFTSTPLSPTIPSNIQNRLMKIIKSNEDSAPTPPPPCDKAKPMVVRSVVNVDPEHIEVIPLEPEVIELSVEKVEQVEPSSNSTAVTPNHLVSILKKKDHSDSNSSANVSPVTFSENVVERRSSERKSRRQGILKKRSSLDESRYQCQSPDENGVLGINVRRNSWGETRHGILKEPPSRDGSTCSQHTPDVTPSEPHHGILKSAKRDDNYSPNTCDPPKHVSISQAVILAVAEMEDQEDLHDGEPDVKPILKPKEKRDGNRKMRPILKKKYSSETEESIRPILKTSRKSSREEMDSSDTESVRPILKGDFEVGPSSTESLVLLVDRETSGQDSVDNSEGRVIEKPLISVAERIKSMESFISQPKPTPPKPTNGRRLGDKDRFKTQPITVEEFSRYESIIILIFGS